MSSKQLRADLLSALQTLAKSDLRASATAFLATLGYASIKTLDLPVEPQAFANEVEKLLGGSKQLNTAQIGAKKINDERGGFHERPFANFGCGSRSHHRY